jgi:hypothetical protein
VVILRRCAGENSARSAGGPGRAGVSPAALPAAICTACGLTQVPQFARQAKNFSARDQDLAERLLLERNLRGRCSAADPLASRPPGRIGWWLCSCAVTAKKLLEKVDERWTLCEAVRTAPGPRQRLVATLGKLEEKTAGAEVKRGEQTPEVRLAGRGPAGAARAGAAHPPRLGTPDPQPDRARGSAEKRRLKPANPHQISTCAF